MTRNLLISRFFYSFKESKCSNAGYILIKKLKNLKVQCNLMHKLQSFIVKAIQLKFI